MYLHLHFYTQQQFYLKQWALRKSNYIKQQTFTVTKFIPKRILFYPSIANGNHDLIQIQEIWLIQCYCFTTETENILSRKNI